MTYHRALLLTLASLSLGVVVAAAVTLSERAPPPRQPVADAATIVTLSPELESQYFGPEAEQGEGGPDSVPLEPWAVPLEDCAEVRALLEAHELERASLERLVWVARAESDCGAESERVNRASGDYGIWQVNWATWGGPLCKRAGICTTPWELAHVDETQVTAALAILEWQGWGAWCWSTPEHHARGIGYPCPWE